MCKLCIYIYIYIYVCIKATRLQLHIALSTRIPARSPHAQAGLIVGRDVEAVAALRLLLGLGSV